MAPDTPKKRTVKRGAVIGAAIAAVVVFGFIWLIVWALGRNGDVVRPTFEDNRAAWESAMAKASVEATFPEGPVDLAQVRPTGSQPLNATFTPDEISALLAVYRHSAPQEGSSVSLSSVRVSVPQAGWVALSGRITVDRTYYSARARGPVTWQDRVEVDERLASVSVEGFTLDGARKQQAVTAIENYLTSLLTSAPGVTVDTATVTEDGFSVTGTAPVRIEHPVPLER